MLQQFFYTAMFVVGLLGLSFMALVGTLAGPHFIRSIVQWINRRDDPRHAKRPPDAP